MSAFPLLQDIGRQPAAEFAENCYVEVIVNLPLVQIHGKKDRAEENSDEAEARPRLTQTFYYAIPSDLSGQVQPGCMVWVPFGKRTLQGIVVGMVSQIPLPTALLKPVTSLVMPEPVLTATQIALARWLSQTYLCSPMEALRLMIPSGTSADADVILRLTTTEPYPMDLSFTQKALLERLRHGPVSLNALKRQSAELVSARVLDSLLRRKLLMREDSLPESKARAKIGKQVRLIADAGQIEQAIPRLGRASKQADILAYLLEQAGHQVLEPELNQVRQALDCGEGPIRACIAQGWVTLLPPRIWVELALNELELEQSIAKLADRAPRQAMLLARLGVHQRSLEVGESGATASAWKPLAAKGYVHLTSEAARVRLALDTGETLQQIIALRNSRAHVAALRALQGESKPVWVGWLYAAADCSMDTLRSLAAAGLVSFDDQEILRDPLSGRDYAPDSPLQLTPEQAQVWRTIAAGLERAFQTPDSSALRYLLHGVTGSGKTEIYLRAIEATLKEGRQALVLVPEIALTPQTVRRFAARFPGQVTVWHSQLSPGERYDAWRQIKAGAMRIVVGARSALFLPFANLGTIIVDEEHEPAYKSEITPRYHARTVATRLAELSHGVIILGSATPDLSTYHASQAGRLTLLEMPHRVSSFMSQVLGSQADNLKDETRLPPNGGNLKLGSMPEVEVVDLRRELRAGNRSIFSRSLHEGITTALAAGQQVILYVNRRGASSFVMCRDCGYVLKCPDCELPLTYHSANDHLICHQCNIHQPQPLVCPNCASPRIRYFGLGTQKLEQTVHELFPTARTLRWDKDMVGTRKGAHEAILDAFSSHQADILIGTQMVAKGLDLPLVTLVGVVSADTALYLPDFRAGERTFQLLTQVAGRAGRGALAGRVVVQTYTPEHYAIQAASRHDYRTFYRQEIAFRRKLGYPPFTRVARLALVGQNDAKVHTSALDVAAALRETAERRAGTERSNYQIIGPAPTFFAREKRRYRWQVIIVGIDPASLIAATDIPLGWRIDIDPVSLL